MADQYSARSCIDPCCSSPARTFRPTTYLIHTPRWLSLALLYDILRDRSNFLFFGDSIYGRKDLNHK
ncbi:hypothetical protein Krac_11021 [Ktedonobacter racemifer DSM 44963]|uniref:Uncharacterized protein n=1 Tax=Ktedonobacter racemifer DSM 44963 TaxID=485913 RepID=D6TJ56_KTERA|nr:hypothetical protein Krac_11021 [Ktedonobacter racemifer DSM 44963]